MQNIIAIVGRPNVGKSSLFNKLIGKRQAIVDNKAGVTRDRLYQKSDWNGKHFKIIDTGGIEISDAPFQQQIQMQVQIAIEEASVIIFVVDGRASLTKDDLLIAKNLYKSNKKIIVAANKLENSSAWDDSIWKLNFEKMFSISALHGEGIGDLLDEATTNFAKKSSENQQQNKIAIIGRPNAGKSSLLNALANEERAIVSQISGTTRDNLDVEIQIDDKRFTIVDTAGINRKSKLVESIDHYALARAKNAINEANIIILLLDYERDLAHFDAVVAGYAEQKNKAIIIAVNKWDIAQKQTNTMEKHKKQVRQNFKFLKWAPIVYISAKTHLRLDKLRIMILEVVKNMQKEIKTQILNDVLNDIQIAQPAQSVNGGRLNVKFARQIEANIPTFILWINRRKYLHFTYQRFLENQLREYFDFTGTPLKLIFRETERKKHET